MSEENEKINTQIEAAEPPKTKGSGALYILLILLTAIIAGGGVWLYYNYKIIPDLENKGQTYQQKQTSPQTAPAAKDETTNWRTYKNVKYGFSLKYPENWYYQETKPTKAIPNTVADLEIGFAQSKKALRCAECDSSSTVNLLINAEDPITKAQIENKKVSQIDIGGVTAEKVEGTYQKDLKWGGTKLIVVTFKKANNNYQFSMWDFVQPENSAIEKNIISKYGNIFNQMLSTFLFTS